MTDVAHENGSGARAGRSLKEELASLRIERAPGRYRAEPARRGGGGGGLGWLAVVLWMVPLGLIGAGGAYAYRQYERFRPKVEVTLGSVQSLTTGEAETLLSAKGYVKSLHQAMIGAKAPGRVEKMLVEEGMRVDAGQLLAVLEHNDTLAMLESRKAMIARSEADLEEARSDFEVKDSRARRWQRLKQHDNATVEEVEKYLSERSMARAKVTGLEASIKLQKAMMKEVEETIRNMHIVAPFAGTVVSKEAEVGETITPGGMGAASGRGAVVTLADLGALEVETDIAENLLSRVAVGQPAEVSVSAVPGKRYRGKLERVVPMGDRTRGTIKVKVRILDADDRLFPELVATVHFLPDRAVKAPDAGKSYLFVPKSALVTEAGHSYVWVPDGKAQVRRRLVEVVVTNDDLARVESGLTAGESVVLNPPKGLREGEPVKAAD